jgi:hypothetical protein
MDPYLERPSLWPDFHASLIIALRDALSPVVGPKYYVAVEERVYLAQPAERRLVGQPDVVIVGEREPAGGASVTAMATTPTARIVEVPIPEPEPARLTYLEVREPPGDEVVTTIEILSHVNKRPGPGRRQYEEKRLEVLSSFTNLVEIDLLRAHPPMEVRPIDGGEASDYRILVSRADQRPRAVLFAFSVREPIPTLLLPLRPGEPEPPVDLRSLLDGIYERAAYRRRVDYRKPPDPRLPEADAEWASAILREQAPQ